MRHRGNEVRVDAADRDDRRAEPGGVANEPGPCAGAAGMARGGKDGSHQEKVGALLDGPLGLLDRVHRPPHPADRKAGPGLRGGEIVGTELDALGTDRPGDVGIARIRVETDYLSFFHPASTIRRDNALIAERLAGTQPIYVVIEGGEARSVTRLELLTAARDLQQFIDAQPGVDKTVGLLDYLGVVRRLLQDDAQLPSLPDSESEIEQLLQFMQAQPDPQACADGLGQLALDSGSRDNVSCVVIDVVETR